MQNIPGQYITLELLKQSHESDLKLLVEDPSIWKYFPYDASGNNFKKWFEKTLKKNKKPT